MSISLSPDARGSSSASKIPEFTCNACSLHITSERWKCSVCVDFDLCSACAQTEPHAHEIFCIPISIHRSNELCGENGENPLSTPPLIWTPKPEMMLLDGVGLYYLDWEAVAMHLVSMGFHASPQQCHKHFLTLTDDPRTHPLYMEENLVKTYLFTLQTMEQAAKFSVPRDTHKIDFQLDQDTALEILIKLETAAAEVEFNGEETKEEFEKKLRIVRDFSVLLNAASEEVRDALEEANSERWGVDGVPLENRKRKMSEAFGQEITRTTKRQPPIDEVRQLRSRRAAAHAASVSFSRQLNPSHQTCYSSVQTRHLSSEENVENSDDDPEVPAPACKEVSLVNNTPDPISVPVCKEVLLLKEDSIGECQGLDGENRKRKLSKAISQEILKARKRQSSVNRKHSNSVKVSVAGVEGHMRSRRAAAHAASVNLSLQLKSSSSAKEGTSSSSEDSSADSSEASSDECSEVDATMISEEVAPEAKVDSGKGSNSMRPAVLKEELITVDAPPLSTLVNDSVACSTIPPKKRGQSKATLGKEATPSAEVGPTGSSQAAVKEEEKEEDNGKGAKLDKDDKNDEERVRFRRKVYLQFRALVVQLRNKLHVTHTSPAYYKDQPRNSPLAALDELVFKHAVRIIVRKYPSTLVRLQLGKSFWGEMRLYFKYQRSFYSKDVANAYSRCPYKSQYKHVQAPTEALDNLGKVKRIPADLALKRSLAEKKKASQQWPEDIIFPCEESSREMTWEMVKADKQRRLSARASQRRETSDISQLPGIKEALDIRELSPLDLDKLRWPAHFLRLGKSAIHHAGVFARKYIKQDAAVVEYTGELVRLKLADVRENMYRSQGEASSYLFRLDAEFVIDATRKGSVARFINHSCNPNCYTAMAITPEGEEKIVVFAGRDICAGEELTYDYKFPKEEEKVGCLCGSNICRGWMN